MSQYKFFHTQQVGGVTIIRLTSADLFDTTVISEMQDVLFELIETEQPANVMIDFAEVQHCSSAVISQLLNLKKRVQSYDGKLKLCGQNDVVRRVFSVLALDHGVFDIYSTEAEALAAFDAS